MRRSNWMLLVVVLVSLGLCSCGGYKFKKLVKPVTGTVLVDGKPQAGVLVSAKPKVDDKTNATYTTATTDSQGKFELGTYDPADGVPPGEYGLTFAWPAGANGVDRFKDRYSDATKSKTIFKIEQEGKDLGKIDLTSK